MNSVDIVLIKWPFTVFSGIKRRPALVLHISKFQDLLLLFITSQQSPDLINSIYPLQPSAQNRLKTPSFLRLDKIITLHSSQSTGVIGKVAESKFYNVIDALSSFIKRLKYT